MCFFFKFFVVYSSDIGSMIAIIGDSFASRGDIWPISIRLPGDVAWSQAAGEYIHIYIYIYCRIRARYMYSCRTCACKHLALSTKFATHTYTIWWESRRYIVSKHRIVCMTIWIRIYRKQFNVDCHVLRCRKNTTNMWHVYSIHRQFSHETTKIN